MVHQEVTGEGKEPLGSKDGRLVDDAKSWQGRKRTEQDLHGLTLGQQVRQPLWDHGTIPG